MRILLCALLPLCVRACGFLDLKCFFENVVQEAGSKLIGNALSAFEEGMDHLFDQDISPLIDKAQTAIDAEIKQAEDALNTTINHVEESIKSIVNDAAATASALAGNITQDVEKIIEAGADAVQKVENTFYTDASRLLDQINAIVQKVSCMEASGAAQLKNQIYTLLKALDPRYRWSKCWRGLGFKTSQTLEDLTEIELYNYQKQCSLLNKITPTTPVNGPNGLLQTYAQGQLYAAEYKCIGQTAGSPAFQDVFAKEWVWWGVQYNAWKQIAAKSIQKQSHVVSVQHARDDPCGTPVECYTQAIKLLQQAEQKIAPLQTAVIQIEHSVTNINQTTTRNEVAISTNSAAASKNAKNIGTNSAAVSKNAKNIDLLPSTLQNVWCNCFTVSTNIDGHGGGVHLLPCTNPGLGVDGGCMQTTCPTGSFATSSDNYYYGSGYGAGLDALTCCEPCIGRVEIN